MELNVHQAPQRARQLRNERGITLIELMISMALSLVVVGAVSYVYVGARGAYRSNEGLARTQEIGRFGLDYIASDLRMVSFAGCRSRNLTTDRMLMIARPVVNFNGVASGVTGFEDGTGWPNATGITRLRGDVFSIRRAAGAGAEIFANTVIGTPSVTIKDNCPRFRKSDVVMLASCERAFVFRVTNDPATTCTTTPTAVTLEHQATGAGIGGVDGNGNNGIVSGSTSHQLYDNWKFHGETRAMVYRFDDIAYFIGQNPAGRPGLYRTSSNGGTEELVENVEDMDVLYGVDTSVPADGIAENYVRADQVADWGQVIALRLSLVAVSPEAALTTQTQTYVLRDTNADGTLDRQNAADSRLRQVFTTTIALRNRVL